MGLPLFFLAGPASANLVACESVDGNLTVSAGDCLMQDGGTVDGDVSNNRSGNVAILGLLDGNLELKGDGGTSSGAADGIIDGNAKEEDAGCIEVTDAGTFDGDIEGGSACWKEPSVLSALQTNNSAQS